MPRRNGVSVICDLCVEEVQDYIFIACGHMFCWPCISKYRDESSSPGNNCPTCYFNQPLQLVSVDRTGQLQLEQSALQRCFMGTENYPVYVITVIGERRSGKSFLMNYLMKGLHNLEKKNHISGAENESLNGFPWRPGTDKVTEGIWIWGKPFLMKNNGNKMAVFLLDSEGTKNGTPHETASMKLFVLTMMISSHLVYNVNADIKETDIDYLEIYCDPMDNDPYHLFFDLKYFDVLVRDRHDSNHCGANFAKSYIEDQIQKLSRRETRSVLNMVEERTVQCFLMPHPGVDIAEDETARLRDMDEDFQRSLRTYLLDVIGRTQNYNSSMTCRKIAAKLQLCMEYVQNARYFSSPLELCNRLKTKAEKKTEMEMEKLTMEFQKFLNNQTQWRLPNKMSTLVSEKRKEVIKTFKDLPLLTRYEYHQELEDKLLDQLNVEGDKFCATHKSNLKYTGLETAIKVGLGAAVATAVPLLIPAAAPVAVTGGWVSTIGGWFSAAPVATTSVSGSVANVAAAGASLL
ncbi:RING finger protein 112-like [Mantella aurantiaca]